MVEFEIKGVKYRANPMDARRQFHVATKLAGLAGSFTGASSPSQAVSTALMSLSVEDSDFVINECLRVVERLDATGSAWAPVMNPAGMIMYDDLRTSLSALIQMVVPVIEANITSFLSEIPNDFVINLMTKMTPKLSS